MRAAEVLQIAQECGFELAGVAPCDPGEDFARYENWVAAGMAGEMRYLTDRRAEMRRDVRSLLPSARSVICVGKLYNTPDPPRKEGDARISRYAWGRDYHLTMRAALERMVARLLEREAFSHKICVDTAPLLERSFARRAGLGWIGKNTCLINEPLGSWFFLGEILTSLDLEPGSPPPDRCGSCTRCIEACPTDALVSEGDGFTLDARRCISYLTIELRGPDSGGTTRGRGRPRFRLRYLPGCLPLELARAVHRRSGFRGVRHSASGTRAANAGRVSTALQRLAHRARNTLRPDEECRDRASRESLAARTHTAPRPPAASTADRCRSPERSRWPSRARWQPH